MACAHAFKHELQLGPDMEEKATEAAWGVLCCCCVKQGGLNACGRVQMHACVEAWL